MGEDSEQEYERIERIRRLLSVKSVGIVGASDHGKRTRQLVENLELYGINSQSISLVNHRAQQVVGRSTVPTLKDLDVAPDLVYSLVPPQATVSVAQEASDLGVGALVVCTGGFAEAGAAGRQMQAALKLQAEQGRVALLGPNTVGYLSPSTGVGAWSGRISGKLEGGGTVLVAQSSGILNVTLDLAAYRDLGVTAALSVGNEAAVEMADIVRYFCSDNEVRVIGLVLEGANSPYRLATAMEAARQAEKRTVVLQIGSSTAGRANSITHSGRIGTGRAGWDALFRKVGATVVHDIDQYMDALELARRLSRRAFRDATPVFLSVSGGDVGLLSDILEDSSLVLPRIAAKTGNSGATTTTVEASHPTDLGQFGGDAIAWLSKVGRPLSESGQSILLVVRLALPWKFDDSAGEPYRELQRESESLGFDVVVMSRGSEPLDSSWFRFLHDLGIPLSISYRPTIEALGALRRTNHGTSVGSRARWSAPRVPRSAEETTWHDIAVEHEEAIEYLTSWEVPYVRHEIGGLEEAPDMADRVGFPVCVKAIVEGVHHKAELGLVMVGVSDGTELKAAMEELNRRVTKVASSAAPRFEIQTMVEQALETYIGVWSDPVVGTVLTVGRGGLALESVKDVVHLLPPCSVDEVETALAGLHRGLRAMGSTASVAALAVYAARVSEIFADPNFRRITQLDLNPVMVSEDGHAVAVDVLMARQQPDRSPRQDGLASMT